jgi:hypothetical protein
MDSGSCTGFSDCQGIWVFFRRQRETSLIIGVERPAVAVRLACRVGLPETMTSTGKARSIPVADAKMSASFHSLRDANDYVRNG